MKAICSCIENISHAVDSVLTKVEEGEPLDVFTVQVVKEKFDQIVKVMVCPAAHSCRWFARFGGTFPSPTI
eukprot:scaffold287219_cov40-Prasinocladus_malaysianus.AAC.2